MDAPKIAVKGNNAKQAYEIKKLWENLVNTQIEGTKATARWSNHWAFAKDERVLLFAPTNNIDHGIALCIHEVGHMDSDYDLIPRARKEGGKLLVFCNNVIEDILVENLQCKRMAGAHGLLRDETNEYTKLHRKKFEADPMWRKRALAVYTMARGYDTVGSFPELADIVNRANRLTTSGNGSYAVAKALYDLIREKEVEAKQPKKEDKKDEKKDGDKGKGEKAPKPEGNEDGSQVDQDDKMDEGTGNSADAPEDEAEGSGSSSGKKPEAEDEGEGSGEKDDEAQPEGEAPVDGSDDEDLVNPFKKPVEESEALEPETSEPSKSREEILEDLDNEVNGYGEESTGIWEGIQAEANKGVDKVMLQFVDARTQPVIWKRPEEFFSYGDGQFNPEAMSDQVKQAYMRLQRILIDADEIQRKKGLKRGKLNGQALHRLQADDDKVFSKRLRGVGVRQFAFSIVVDESSSMSGRKNIEARNSAYIIAETLDKLHIPFNLTGFLYHMGIYNFNFKDFGEAWSVRKDSLRYMRTKNSNMDCHSITEVYKRLVDYPATHRVMIVISDGQPCPENPSILKETVPLWEKKVKVIGIGLDYGDIVRFYKNAVATTADKLPFELAKLLQKVIFEA